MVFRVHDVGFRRWGCYHSNGDTNETNMGNDMATGSPHDLNILQQQQSGVEDHAGFSVSTV